MTTAAIHVTSHAVSRYRSRVAQLPDREVRAALRSPTITLAAAIGAPFVRLPGGQRVVLAGCAVLTVLPRDYSVAALRHHQHEGREV